jgi:hypothetical protein
MDVVFKAINNKTYPYNVNPEDSISSVLDKLYVDSGISKETHSFKIIFQGKILSSEQKFSEFAPVNPKDKPMFVFMSSKNKPAVSEQSKPQAPSASQSVSPPPAPTVSVQNIQSSFTPTPVTNPTQATNTNSSFVQSLLTNPDDGYEEAMDEMDETDKLRASLVGMMVFIRANPQMMELFNSNFEAFAQVIMSPQFKPMFQSMLSDTHMGDEQLDNLSGSMLSHGQEQEQPQTVSLTQEDLNNIGTLEALGFPKQACMQAYILANKNLDMAASMLMDM